MRQKLYPKERFPDGHPELATSLNNLGGVVQALGQPAKALPHYEQALAMNKKLYPKKRFPKGHPELAHSLNNLGGVREALGQPAKALPHYEQALAMRQKLYPKERFPDGHPQLAHSLNNLGGVLRALGQPAKALLHYEQALAMFQKLYPMERFPNGHPELATNLNNLGGVLEALGQPAKALPHYEQTLAMFQKLYPRERFPNGHPHLATSLNNLASVLQFLGQPAKALPHSEQALAMRQKLYPKERFPDGHPELATSLNNLGGVLEALGQPAKALPHYEQALAMRQKLYPKERFPDGHPELATSLNNLGSVLRSLGQPAKALPHSAQALAMRQKLYPKERFPDGHPELAHSLNNLGFVLRALGQPAKALPPYEEALAMCQGLYPKERFPDGHPHLAQSLSDLGGVLEALAQPVKALPRLEQAVAMYGRLTERDVAGAPEGQALALLASLPRTRDGYLSLALRLPRTAAASYQPVWAGRAAVLRLLLRRHQAAQVARLRSADARRKWQQLAEARREVRRLLLEPGRDPAARDRLLAQSQQDQERLERQLAGLVPELEEHRRLALLGPNDLATALPDRSAFVDLLRCAHFEKAKFTGWRYLAFVVTAGPRIRRVDLGDAEAIDAAVASWRRSIDRREASAAPARLRELVWDKVERLLPEGTSTVYLCPDGELTRLPYAALAGRKAGTVLLEDYTLAVVPAGFWLLHQLRQPKARESAKEALLAVGAVEFGKAPAGKKGYEPLPETGRELKRVQEAFAAPAEGCLRGGKATTVAVLHRLPNATVAHLATHGYFDQDALLAEHRRATEQRKRWTFQESGTQRAGLGAANPLGYVGLALAGASDPSKADRGGVITGLDLLELDLSKLRLCVLSACESGLGEWTEHGGVAGLQRAFHLAGCRNVVGSLWPVNDAATAALMAQFYHELRVNKRTPLEALRQAQLTIYRHPERIPDLAGERGRPALEKAAKLGSAPAARPAGKAKTADTKLWAAFVLSGVGD
jgi:CHAT domain-containing protein/Tfp pilus assembly protein PilF